MIVTDSLYYSLQCDKERSKDKSPHKSCKDKCSIYGDQNSNTTLASRESCRGNQNCEKKGGGSDCGYSSGADGCDNCSVPSSNDSDVVYLDNVCSSQDGEYLLPLTPDPFCPLKSVAKHNIVQSSVFF